MKCERLWGERCPVGAGHDGYQAGMRENGYDGKRFPVKPGMTTAEPGMTCNRPGMTK